MGRTVTADEIKSRTRCAVVVGRIWDAVIAATEADGEFTGWELAWILHEIHGRFIAIELNRERTGKVDPSAEG